MPDDTPNEEPQAPAEPTPSEPEPSWPDVTETETRDGNQDDFGFKRNN